MSRQRTITERIAKRMRRGQLARNNLIMSWAHQYANARRLA